VTLRPPHGPTLLEVSMIQPSCPIYVAAASQIQIADVALRDRSKYRAHAGHLHPGRTFVSASVEPYSTSASLLCGTYVPYARSLWRALSCCHPGAVSCKCPPGTECSSCTTLGICLPLLRAAACQGCGAAGVTRGGYALPYLSILLWLQCLWVRCKCFLCL
jgi:hypothetical protein